MRIDSSILYAPCPCGSGKKFKFCCWPKCRDSFNDDMTKAQFVQTVRCTAVGIYDNMNASEGGEVCEWGRQNLLEGRFEKARPLFRKARTLDPKMWVAWNNEAICAWETGFVEEAYDLQRKGIEVAPVRNTYGCASMAIFSHVLGRDNEAAEWLERALADFGAPRHAEPDERGTAHGHVRRLDDRARRDGKDRIHRLRRI